MYLKYTVEKIYKQAQKYFYKYAAEDLTPRIKKLVEQTQDTFMKSELTILAYLYQHFIMTRGDGFKPLMDQATKIISMLPDTDTSDDEMVNEDLDDDGESKLSEESALENFIEEVIANARKHPRNKTRDEVLHPEVEIAILEERNNEEMDDEFYDSFMEERENQLGQAGNLSVYEEKAVSTFDKAQLSRDNGNTGIGIKNTGKGSEDPTRVGKQSERSEARVENLKRMLEEEKDPTMASYLEAAIRIYQEDIIPMQEVIEGEKAQLRAKRKVKDSDSTSKKSYDKLLRDFIDTVNKTKDSLKRAIAKKNSYLQLYNKNLRKQEMVYLDQKIEKLKAEGNDERNRDLLILMLRKKELDNRFGGYTNIYRVQKAIRKLIKDLQDPNIVWNEKQYQNLEKALANINMLDSLKEKRVSPSVDFRGTVYFNIQRLIQASTEFFVYQTPFIMLAVDREFVKFMETSDEVASIRKEIEEIKASDNKKVSETKAALKKFIEINKQIIDGPESPQKTQIQAAIKLMEKDLIAQIAENERVKRIRLIPNRIAKIVEVYVDKLTDDDNPAVFLSTLKSVMNKATNTLKKALEKGAFGATSYISEKGKEFKSPEKRYELANLREEAITLFNSLISMLNSDYLDTLLSPYAGDKQIQSVQGTINVHRQHCAEISSEIVTILNRLEMEEIDEGWPNE